MDKQAFEDEAQRLLKAADAGGVTLRVLGAVAFARRCPRHAHLQDTLGRAYTDIDFAGYGRQVAGIRSVLGKEGYAEDEMTYVESEGSRMVLNHPRTGLHLDVFLDQLSFCHTVRWDARMQAERDTIPLAEMLLQKMQIVQINEKDIIDTIMLLLEHPLGDEDGDVINIGLVADICAKDWGWWRTITGNLDKLMQLGTGEHEDLVPEARRHDPIAQARQIKAFCDSCHKTLKWKIRSKVGDRVQWYELPEEVGH